MQAIRQSKLDLRRGKGFWTVACDLVSGTGIVHCIMLVAGLYQLKTR